VGRIVAGRRGLRCGGGRCSLLAEPLCQGTTVAAKKKFQHDFPRLVRATRFLLGSPVLKFNYNVKNDIYFTDRGVCPVFNDTPLTHYRPAMPFGNKKKYFTGSFQFSIGTVFFKKSPLWKP